MSSASNSSIVTSKGKGESPGLPHKPLSGKESGPYDQLEASETYRYVTLPSRSCHINDGDSRGDSLQLHQCSRN